MTVASKPCTKCGVVKPLTEFHRKTASKDGYETACKPCRIPQIRAAQERRRERIGDDEYRREQREKVRRLRAQDPLRRSRDRAESAAYYAAQSALRDAHRKEFDALLARERYERGLD